MLRLDYKYLTQFNILIPLDFSMLPAAYYVFSNEVMGQIVAAKPTNVKDLLRVKGKKEKEEEGGRRRKKKEEELD
jgi:hypothetical protein